MSDNLREDSIHAFVWSTIERFGLQGLQLISSIIMTRLLVPSDFGLIAMCTFFIALAQTLINSGFGQALIQKQNASDTDISSIFYFNIIVSFFLAIILAFCSNTISIYFNEMKMKNILYLSSINLVLSSFGMIHITLIKKELLFKKLFLIGFISVLISSIMGIVLAFLKLGYYSIIISTIIGTIINVYLSWYYSSWRPSLKFKIQALKNMFKFGSNLLIVGIINAFFSNIYTLIIGKLYSIEILGFYSRAESLQQYAVANTTNIINQVTFPIFSKISYDKERLKRGIKQTLVTAMMLILPGMAFLYLFSDEIITIIFTKKWLPASNYFKLFCVIGVFYPIHSINVSILNAQGRSDYFLKLEIIKKILFLIIIILTFKYEVTYMLIGQIIFSIVSLFINSYFTNKLINYSLSEQLVDILPYFFVTIFMTIALYLFKKANIINNIYLFLIVEAALALILYTLICNIFKLKYFNSFVEIILKYRFIN